MAQDIAVQMRFRIPEYSIERGTLILSRIEYHDQRTVIGSTTGNEMGFETRTAFAETDLQDMFPTYNVVEEIAQLVLERPALIEGTLTHLTLRRLTDAMPLDVLVCEFSHYVTSEELQSGFFAIDLTPYKLVRIKVPDYRVRPAYHETLSMVRAGRAGSIEFGVNEIGEAVLMVPPGKYRFRRPGRTPVQFEIMEQETLHPLELSIP